MSNIVVYTKGDELLQQANSLEVYVGSKDRKMIVAAGKKAIADYSQAELMHEIQSLTVGLFRVIGIHKAPDQFDNALLYQSLVERFSELTLTDVRNAFEMHIMGDLEGYVPKDHDHFQQFSFKFYAKILKGYMQKRREVMHDVNGKVQLRLMDNNRSEGQKSGHGKLNLLRLLRENCHRYLMTGEDHFLIHDAMLSILKGIGLLEHIPEPSVEHLKAASADLSKRVDWSVANAYRKAIENGEAPENVRRVATVRATRQALHKAIQDAGIDRIDEMFAWGEQRVIEHFKIVEDAAPVQKEG
jgi:hypothetical protein